MGWSNARRRTDGTRLIQLRTDGTGSSPWTRLDDSVMWWQVLGSPGAAAYMVQMRPAQTTLAVPVQVLAANQYRTDVFVGCPELEVRVTNATANTVYMLACNAGDFE